MKVRLLLAAIVVIQAFGVVTASNAGAMFSGRVLDLQTQRPIGKARVELIRPRKTIIPFTMESQGTFLARTFSDAHGRFAIRTNSRGPYDLYVFRPGPFPAWVKRGVRPGEWMQIYYPPPPVPYSLGKGADRSKKGSGK